MRFCALNYTRTGLFVLLLLTGRGYSFAQQASVLKAQALEDIAYYQQTLETMHYNPFLRLSQHEYTLKAEQLKGSIRDSITISDLLLFFPAPICWPMVPPV